MKINTETFTVHSYINPFKGTLTIYSVGIHLTDFRRRVVRTTREESLTATVLNNNYPSIHAESVWSLKHENQW